MEEYRFTYMNSPGSRRFRFIVVILWICLIVLVRMPWWLVLSTGLLVLAAGNFIIMRSHCFKGTGLLDRGTGRMEIKLRGRDFSARMDEVSTLKWDASGKPAKLTVETRSGTRLVIYEGVDKSLWRYYQVLKKELAVVRRKP